MANAGDKYTYGVDNMRAWKLKPDGTEELQLYGAHGERLGTYPIWPNPNGTYLFYVAAGTTVLILWRTDGSDI